EGANAHEIGCLRGVVAVARATRASGSAVDDARTLLARAPTPSPDRLVSDLAQLARAWLAAEVAPSGGAEVVLQVGADAAVFQIGAGPRFSLARRAVLRALLRALVSVPPGTPVSADALREAGWPGQAIRHEAAL